MYRKRLVTNYLNTFRNTVSKQMKFLKTFTESYRAKGKKRNSESSQR
jgi:hypothetical protein